MLGSRDDNEKALEGHRHCDGQGSSPSPAWIGGEIARSQGSLE